MEFIIRKAQKEDLPGIMKIMEEARRDSEHPDWFVADDENYVREHLDQNGFTVIAQAQDGTVAGFFLIKYPDLEDNLGRYLDFKEDQLAQVAVMDSAAVGSAYRGNGLQGKMLETAEAFLDREKIHYLMCTIHPDNRFSRQNMEKHGYEVKKITECYGGLMRCILLKEC